MCAAVEHLALAVDAGDIHRALAGAAFNHFEFFTGFAVGCYLGGFFDIAAGRWGAGGVFAVGFAVKFGAVYFSSHYSSDRIAIYFGMAFGHLAVWTGHHLVAHPTVGCGVLVNGDSCGAVGPVRTVSRSKEPFVSAIAAVLRAHRPVKMMRVSKLFMLKPLNNEGNLGCTVGGRVRLVVGQLLLITPLLLIG